LNLIVSFYSFRLLYKTKAFIEGRLEPVKLPLNTPMIGLHT